MIINIQENGRILKTNFNIFLPNFTVLTGENGSGKTQLLESIRDGAFGFDYNASTIFYSITDDSSRPLTDIVYSYPGLKNEEYEYQTDASLIQQIRNEWNNLMPIAKSHGVIAHKRFNNEEDELHLLNAAMVDFARSLAVDPNQFYAKSCKQASQYQLDQLKTISKKADKPIDSLSFIDFLIFYTIPTNIFSSALDLLFHQFHLKDRYYRKLTKDMSPPWTVFNSILEEANFKYQVKYIASDDEEYPSQIKFIDSEKNVTNTTINSLSSGEMTIMALIFVLYHASNNGNFPEVILFDEPDAHLHPSLTQLFISVIQKILIDKQQVKVILTTHSPSTIALSPKESIYVMNRDLGYPVKEDRNKAIQNLSNGLASVTIEEGNMGVEYTLKSTDKNILFTEGITDKIILEIAWKKLNENNELPFLIQDCFCASFLSNLFQNGDQKHEGIFELAPEKIMIALFDFDQAGYNSWNRIKFREKIENDPRNCLTMSNGKKGFKMLLPAPNIPEIKSQVIRNGNETFEDKSLVTIESLLFAVGDFKDRYFKMDIQPGGGLSYQFKGDKRTFAKNVELLDAEAFVEFIPLFKKISEIFEK
jgi:hypothetical protein